MYRDSNPGLRFRRPTPYPLGHTRMGLLGLFSTLSLRSLLDGLYIYSVFHTHIIFDIQIFIIIQNKINTKKFFFEIQITIYGMIK